MVPQLSLCDFLWFSIHFIVISCRSACDFLRFLPCPALPGSSCPALPCPARSSLPCWKSGSKPDFCGSSAEAPRKLRGSHGSEFPAAPLFRQIFSKGSQRQGMSIPCLLLWLPCPALPCLLHCLVLPCSALSCQSNVNSDNFDY